MAGAGYAVHDAVLALFAFLREFPTEARKIYRQISLFKRPSPSPTSPANITLDITYKALPAAHLSH